MTIASVRASFWRVLEKFFSTVSYAAIVILCRLESWILGRKSSSEAAMSDGAGPSTAKGSGRSTGEISPQVLGVLFQTLVAMGCTYASVSYVGIRSLQTKGRTVTIFAAEGSSSDGRKFMAGNIVGTDEVVHGQLT